MGESIGNNEGADSGSANKWDTLGSAPSWDEIKARRENATTETEIYWVNDEEVKVNVGGDVRVMKAEDVPKEYGDNKDVMMEYDYLMTQPEEPLEPEPEMPPEPEPEMPPEPEPEPEMPPKL